ncbi:hypothetical protein CASFOL_010529 [Castilleja foliolosa]|uniref:Protein kinase domain-containing protein n=1 Tax=Castilleja foliolosa TaxID=1961234 RepID=A0ABD3DWP4_9LAMI
MQNSRNSLFVLFLISLSCSNYFINPTTGNTAELSTLMEIKKSLDPQGKLLVSWKKTGDPCGGTFAGVACNENRKVANISLQGKGLTGKLPAAVAELKCLSGLYLHYNFLTGQIPKEIAKLTELTDLYLNFNNLTGTIPSQIGSMSGLQVLQLGYNKLTGNIPLEIGSLKNLNFLALESNKLSGQISDSLGNLRLLKRLYLSYNQLSGPIPVALAKIPSLQALHVQNNTLSGLVPLGFQELNSEFQFQNNPGLCGTGISTLRACTPFDNVNVYLNSSITNRSGPTNIPRSATFPLPCNQSTSSCSKPSSKLPQIGIVAGVIILTVALTVVVFLGIVKYRRQKQKIGNKSDISGEDRLSIDPSSNDLYKRNPSSHHIALDVSNGWDPVNNGALDRNGSRHSSQQGSSNKFNMEEVESATRHFSETNLLGKSKFSAVYKGILKDGSITAIKSINRTSRKSEEDEFLKGLSLLSSIKHENLLGLKGFCCSKARGECFLVYNFAPRGSLSRYLNADNGSIEALDWPTRVSIIHGIAKGIEYLHSNETNKPPIIHQNISVEKVLLDQQYRPLISDAGLLRLLADDVVYSALKVSAALGYMAPEYITTGRFTEKSDVYAFGVIIFQVLCGRTKLPGTARIAAESGKFEEFIDSKLDSRFSETEVTRLTKIALDCTNEIPEKRPSMKAIVRELNDPKGG